MASRDINVAFCSALLYLARSDAKALGVEVPKGLSTFYNTIGSTRHYEVYAQDKGLVWSGTATCAYDAKAKYIESLIVAVSRRYH